MSVVGVGMSRIGGGGKVAPVPCPGRAGDELLYHMTYPMMHWMVPDACENITFPKLCLRVVENVLGLWTITRIIANLYHDHLVYKNNIFLSVRDILHVIAQQVLRLDTS